MRIVRLAAGSHWTVCAVCADGACPVLDYIAELETDDPKKSRKVTSDLTDFAPNSSNATWIAQEFSTDLGDGIYEFRWNGKGGAPRVLWFYDANQLVVCVHGTTKKARRLSPEDMALAKKRQEEYFAAKRAGKLEVVSLAEFESEKTKSGD